MGTTVKTLTLILTILLFNIQNMVAQCHIDDWYALRLLYINTDGDNWNNNTGWEEVTSNAPPGCNLNLLHGASLNEQGRVETLDLENNLLSGSIPTEMGDLGSLTRLYLYNNLLIGSIPAEIGNLSNLTDLSLGDNQLDGSISAELGNLNKLTHLYLYDNLLTGSIPVELGNLNSLTSLRLQNNQLSGNIPAELGNLNNLTGLSLQNNQLSGSIPIELGNLSNLTSLRLQNNQLSGSIPAGIGNITNLTYLSLSGNELSGSIPYQLGNLNNLVFLWLYENQLSGSLPSEICNMTNLTLLEINDNNLQGCYPVCMSTLCTQLNAIDFNGNLDISHGNNLDATWEDFCATNAGKCIPCEENCETNVYPGDLNHDGIVNNQDIGISTLHLYNTGIPRASEEQNTSWNPHPSEDWGIAQHNNKDLKHHDCNGDGVIDENDHQAITDNWGATWTTPVALPSTPISDYQVLLQPTEQLLDGFLIMNVSLERRAGGDLTVQGGHFTVDYSDIEANFNTSTLNFLPASWLGVPNINLWYESENFPIEKKIEVGFTKTNNANSNGNGVIGQLILEYDNSAARLSRANDITYQFKVHTIGTHNANEFIPIENQTLQVNFTNNCQSNWTIDENTPFQNLYQSSNNITTNGFVLIGTDQEVEYNANRVRLNSDFSIKAGADFKVRSSGCN